MKWLSRQIIISARHTWCPWWFRRLSSQFHRRRYSPWRKCNQFSHIHIKPTAVGIITIQNYRNRVDQAAQNIIIRHTSQCTRPTKPIWLFYRAVHRLDKFISKTISLQSIEQIMRNKQKKIKHIWSSKHKSFANNHFCLHNGLVSRHNYATFLSGILFYFMIVYFFFKLNNLTFFPRQMIDHHP